MKNTRYIKIFLKRPLEYINVQKNTYVKSITNIYIYEIKVSIAFEIKQ